MDKQNTFETHITLALPERIEFGQARSWAQRANLKWTEIELNRGMTQIQPMITFWGAGSLEDQLRQAAAYQLELASMAYIVVRVKTEVAADETQMARTNQYFECHVKLHLKCSSELQAAHDVAVKFRAHMSRNSRRIRQDGTEERFLTLRSYSGTSNMAAVRQTQLLSGIRLVNLDVLEVESEFVLYDSNLNLDAGWESSNV